MARVALVQRLLCREEALTAWTSSMAFQTALHIATDVLAGIARVVPDQLLALRELHKLAMRGWCIQRRHWRRFLAVHQLSLHFQLILVRRCHK